MGVIFDGKINFLSGHYQDIIISENAKNSFHIKITPSEFYRVEKLDESYSHITFDKLSTTEKINQIINSYLYHNTLFMLASRGRVRKHTGEYKALNAFPTIIEGYQSTARPLYMKLTKETETEVLNKVNKKYQEDRIRHLKQILNCHEIVVNSFLEITSYMIKGEKAYITLCAHLDKKLKSSLYQQEISFLKILLKEFIKKYGEHIKYEAEQVVVYSEDYKRKVELEEEFYLYLLEVKKEDNIRKKEQCHDMTIEEYLHLVKINKNTD